MSGQLDRPPAVVRGIEVSTIANYEGEAILTCQAQAKTSGLVRPWMSWRPQAAASMAGVFPRPAVTAPHSQVAKPRLRAENEAVRSVDVHSMSVQSLQLL